MAIINYMDTKDVTPAADRMILNSITYSKFLTLLLQHANNFIYISKATMESLIRFQETRQKDYYDPSIKKIRKKCQNLWTYISELTYQQSQRMNYQRETDYVLNINSFLIAMRYSTLLPFRFPGSRWLIQLRSVCKLLLNKVFNQLVLISVYTINSTKAFHKLSNGFQY